MSKISDLINPRVLWGSIGMLCFTVFYLFVSLPPVLATSYPRQDAIVQAVRRVGPAVVNISSEYEIRKHANHFGPFGMDPFFDSFFKDFFDPRFTRREKRTSLGSGVIIDGRRGFILTNAHVIERTGVIRVMLRDEREFEAKIIGVDVDSDLAVLKISVDQQLPDVQMGDSDDIMIGETVIAIGNPFGFSHTVTTGVVSSAKRSIKTDQRVYHEFIQTDASINPGNSGGPLLNINGELIGINTAIYAQAQGIGFAIPINRARRIISDLIQHGKVVHAWVGAIVQDIDERLAGYLSLKPNTGVLVASVEQQSPASKAGIKDGDVILSIRGRKVHHKYDYISMIKELAVGTRFEMTLLRDGSVRKVHVKTSVFPAARAKQLTRNLLGIEVAPLDKAHRDQFQLNAVDGVVITHVSKDTYLYQVGVRPGDVIRQMDDRVIHGLADFNSAMIRCRRKSAIAVLLQHNHQLYQLTLALRR